MKINKSKGISLIVLIVTIIVVIILAAVVILTLSKNNPIESAKEARFKEDVRTFQDELAMTVSKQYTQLGGHRDYKINTSDFEEIKGYIPSFNEKYKDKFVIQDDELKYTKKVTDNEKEWLEHIKIKSNSLLPKEFKQVEYIESTGTQYINTKYICNSNTEVSMKYNLTRMPSNFCSLIYNGESGTQFSQVGMESYQGNLRIGVGDFIIEIPSNDLTLKEVYFSKDRIVLNNETINRENDLVYILPSVPKGMSIFAATWSNRNYIYYLAARVYYLKISENNKLIRDFIPCKTKEKVVNMDGDECDAGTIGLYDTVEGKFYTNQGDKTKGDFIPGPEVN